MSYHSPSYSGTTWRRGENPGPSINSFYAATVISPNSIFIFWEALLIKNKQKRFPLWRLSGWSGKWNAIFAITWFAHWINTAARHRIESYRYRVRTHGSRTFPSIHRVLRVTHDSLWSGGRENDFGSVATINDDIFSYHGHRKAYRLA